MHENETVKLLFALFKSRYAFMRVTKRHYNYLDNRNNQYIKIELIKDYTILANYLSIIEILPNEVFKHKEHIKRFKEKIWSKIHKLTYHA